MNTEVYLYRRKGNLEWATCDLPRFVELSSHKLFDTKTCYEKGRLDQLGALLHASLPAVKYESQRGDDAGRQYRELAEKIEVALKPTESGASE